MSGHPDYMQQDKFERAAACIDENASDSSISSFPFTPSSLIVSPNKRHKSSPYWENKFDQALDIIQALRESSINIQEIPGFLSIQKVKPKLSKSTTRVTQIYGSMKAKTVLETLKDLDEKKKHVTYTSSRDHKGIG